MHAYIHVPIHLAHQHDATKKHTRTPRTQLVAVHTYTHVGAPVYTYTYALYAARDGYDLAHSTSEDSHMRRRRHPSVQASSPRIDAVFRKGNQAWQPHYAAKRCCRDCGAAASGDQRGRGRQAAALAQVARQRSVVV